MRSAVGRIGISENLKVITKQQPIMGAYNWSTNAHLIEDCAKLGYMKKDERIVDVTYGDGKWWTRWSPDNLIKHDLYKLDGVDFRHLPEQDNSFDVVAFDPPYVSIGGRMTSTINPFYDRYGNLTTPKSPMELQMENNDGLTEVYRVLDKGGRCLSKCQDYISSGKLFIGTYYTLTHALGLGFELIDRFEMVGSVRAQPAGRRQVHARRNNSTLFVFKKNKRS